MNSSRKTSTNWLSAIGYRLSAIGLLALIFSFLALNAHANSFRVIADGSVVRDESTNLVWKRCSVGQTWNGKTCEGNAKSFTFLEAQGLQSDGWRLPTARELSTLLDCTSKKTRKDVDLKDGGATVPTSCDGNFVAPTIHKTAFPNAKNGEYWTSSRVPGKPDDVWFVYLDKGTVNPFGSIKHDSRSVFLVKADTRTESATESATRLPTFDEVLLAEEKVRKAAEEQRRAEALKAQALRDAEARAAEAKQRAYENSPAGRAEAREREQAAARQRAYENSPAGVAERQGRQLCEAQKATCVASCPFDRVFTTLPDTMCRSRCESVSCR